MAASETEIANMALGKLGSVLIEDINAPEDETNKQSYLCRLHYAQARDSLLRRHPWNFSMKRAELSRLAEPPLFGWAAQYSLPDDFLRMVQVDNMLAWDNRARQVDLFRIEGGKLLLKQNPTTSAIVYVSRVIDTTKFDALFTDALVTFLASKMAKALTGSETREQQLLSEFAQLQLPEARFTDAQEDGKTPLMAQIARSNMIRVHRGGFGWDGYQGWGNW